MASLTYTAYVSRRLIKFGGIGLAVFTTFYLLFGVAMSAWRAAHPKYTAPDFGFGLLPKTVFPEKSFEKKEFVAELPKDSFPKFKDQTKVYVIVRPDNTFLALNQDSKTASSLGFNEKPAEVRYGVYEFKNNTLNQTLTMNVLDGSFHLVYPYEKDQLLLNPERMPSKDEAIGMAKSYLSTANKFPEDLDTGEKKVSYWKIGYEGLKSVSSLSEANIVRVDFFRQDVEDGVRIVSSDVNSASVSVLVTGAQMEGKRIAEVSYKYADIDRELFSTYPIKTAEEAWNDLTMGNYWPASDVEGDTVTIRNMYLAYFEPVSLTNYLQPIFVFEGDKNFVAYVTAVADKYVR